MGIVLRTLKWLHLSDFHFGKKPHNLYQQPFVAAKIVQHAISQGDKEGAPDFFFITGDIANSGSADEYALFNEHLIHPLIEHFGETYLDRIFIVPGNHDIQRDVHRNFGRDEHLVLEGNFEPTPESRKDRSMLIDRLQNFINGSYGTDLASFEKDAGAYCRIMTVNEVRIGVVGLNTSWLCRDEHDKGKLTPGIPLVRDILEKTNECELVVVLGHHPLDWLSPNHVEPIKTLLGKHNVLYLHGHMHKVWGKPEYANGSSFMTVQAGASFQAPETSEWKNSILWGEAKIDTKIVSFQPFIWSFTEQNWKLDSAGFPEAHRVGVTWDYQLPQPVAAPRAPATRLGAPPGGWKIIGIDSLAAYVKPIEEDLAVYFFDGASPTWEVALSTSIPKREIVTEIQVAFNRLKSNSSELPAVFTLLAAGCEGKTTALLQAGYEILKERPNKKILYRNNNLRPFDAEALLPFLNTHDDWLFVIDEADQVAKSLLDFIEGGVNGYSGQVDMILACRDSDWRANEASSLPWSFSCAYKEIVLKDLNKADAERIVNSWEAFGQRGLGDGGLANLDSSGRVEKLRFFAKQESKRASGAFFGALLLSRHNGQLLDHAEAMLSRLDETEVSEGKTLRDALAYIAVMHAEGFEKLTYDVLAAAMNMSIPRLKNIVLNKLGDEAAATGTSTTVFTRHRYIAEALVEVLERNFDVDTASLFVDLAVAAEEKAKTERVSNFDFWRFKMADAFFEKGKNVVAITLSESLLKTDPGNYKLLTKLAKFYRRENSSADALVLFGNYKGEIPEQGFYFEWALCELESRNLIESATFALFSLSDEAENTRLDIPGALMYLTGVTKILVALHRDYADGIFVQALDAAWSIMDLIIRLNPGKPFPGHKAYLNKVDKKRAKNYLGADAVRVLLELCEALSNYKSNASLPDGYRVQSLSFQALKVLVNNVSR